MILNKIVLITLVSSCLFACKSEENIPVESEATCEEECLNARTSCRASATSDVDCTATFNGCLSACDADGAGDDMAGTDEPAAGETSPGGETAEAGEMSEAGTSAGDESVAGDPEGTESTAGAEEDEVPFERYDGKWTVVTHSSEMDECGNGIVDATGLSSILRWGVRSVEFVTEQVDYNCAITGTNKISCRNLRFYNGAVYFNWDIENRIIGDGRIQSSGELVMECGLDGGCAQIEANLGVQFPCTSTFVEEMAHVPYEEECSAGEIDEMAEPLDGVWATVSAQVSEETNECMQTIEELRQFGDWVQIGATTSAIEFTETGEVIIAEREGNNFTGERAVNYYGQDWQVRVIENISGGYTANDRMHRTYMIDATCTEGNCDNAPVPIPCRSEFVLCSKHVE